MQIMDLSFHQNSTNWHLVTSKFSSCFEDERTLVLAHEVGGDSCLFGESTMQHPSSFLLSPA